MPRLRRIMHCSAMLLIVLSPATQAQAPDVASDTQANKATPDSTLKHDATPHFKLEAHTAKYSARFKKGISVNGSGVRELKALGNNRWRYRFDVDSLPVDIRESVEFLWKDSVVRPSKYQYSRKGFFIREKNRSIRFDWENNRAKGNNTGKSWKLSIPANSLDKLSYQVQLLADIALSKTPMHYQVVHKGRVEDSQFRVIKEESLKTSIGTQQSVVVEKIRSPDNPRQTLLWFSKTNPLLLLKMYQQEKDGDKYEITLQSLTM